jgi:hypothetical protein
MGELFLKCRIYLIICLVFLLFRPNGIGSYCFKPANEYNNVEMTL